MPMKIRSNPTFSSDSANLKQFNEMASCRAALRLQIAKAQKDSGVK